MANDGNDCLNGATQHRKYLGKMEPSAGERKGTGPRYGQAQLARMGAPKPLAPGPITAHPTILVALLIPLGGSSFFILCKRWPLWAFWRSKTCLS